MEFLSVLMDLIPPSVPPGEPGLIAKMIAAVSAAAGGIVFGAVSLIKKAFDNKKRKK